MNGRPTLYEVLGVPASASVAELQAGFRHQVSLLEERAPAINPQERAEKMQWLRLALSTLTDPVSRLGYDRKLDALQQGAGVARMSTGALAPLADPRLAGAEVRADALALRADALSLRADALLVRAGLDGPLERRGGLPGTLASGALVALKRLASALGLLVLIGIIAFFATRAMRGDPSARQAAMEAKAHEQTALQEYYQTHGVRPANMAELELLEADRRRRQIETQHASQDAAAREREARQFEEDARRRGREVAAELSASEEQARRAAQQESYAKLREEQIRLETERTRMLSEQMRLERERHQWREVLER